MIRLFHKADHDTALVERRPVDTAILLPLSLMAGLHGMNLANIPELQWRWDYFALLGIMGPRAIGQWIYFSRRALSADPASAR